MKQNNIDKDSIGYVGDDLNDLESMKFAGFVACPSDSSLEIVEIADYVSPVKGGYGVITDVVRHILKKLAIWENIISNLYGGI